MLLPWQRWQANSSRVVPSVVLRTSLPSEAMQLWRRVASSDLMASVAWVSTDRDLAEEREDGGLK